MFKLSPVHSFRGTTCIRAMSLVIVGAASLALSACYSKTENMVENVAVEYENATEAMDANAAETGNDVAVIDNQLENLGAAGEVNSSNNESEIIFCQRLSDQSTRRECDLYNQIWSNLSPGAGGIKFPDEMVRGETRRVSFVISRSKDVSTDILLGEKADKEFELKVARRMAAQLQGEGFAIDPSMLVYRDLHIGQGARWDWSITAMKGSRHSLTLSAYVVVNSPDGKGNETLLKSYSQDIPVSVTWLLWYEDWVENVRSFSTTTKALFVALGALLVALSLFRKQVIAFFKEILNKKD
jgi:hypothetical protein